MAIADLLLKITGSNDAAKRSLADTSRAMADLGRQEAEARVNVQTQAANVQLDRVKQRLENLQRQEPSPTVTIRQAAAIAQIERLEGKLAKLDARRVEVNVDVDKDAAGRFGLISKAVEGLAGALSSGGGSGGGLTGATARVNAGFLSFGAATGPVAAILAAVAVAIGTALVGALAALVASLAMAAAAIGALGAAIAGALGPAVALAVGVFGRLAKIIEAVRAQDNASDQAARKQAAGTQAAAQAAETRRRASEALADANRDLGRATAQAYREMQDAAEAASDAIRGIEQAQLSLQSAKLGVREATQALKDFRNETGTTGSALDSVFQKFTDVDFTGDLSGLRGALEKAGGSGGGGGDELELERRVLAVKEARLRQKDATDGVSDAQRILNRAQQDNNRFQNLGIAASASYAAALDRVRDAQRQVTTAASDPALSDAQANALQLTGRLSDAEQRFLTALQNVRKELGGFFGPATDQIFGALADALGRLPGLLKPLRGAFKRLGGAVATVIDSLSKGLDDPQAVTALRDLVDASARLIGPVAQGMAAFFGLLANVARATMPFLLAGVKGVADQFTRWSGQTGNVVKLQIGIGLLVGHLKLWLGIAGQLGRAFLGFIIAAEPVARDLAGRILAAATGLADWANSAEGRESIRQFLEDVVPLAISFARFIFKVVTTLGKLGQIIAPVLTPLLDLITWVVDAIGKWADATRQISGLFWRMIGRILDRLGGLGTAIGKSLEDALAVIGALATNFYELGRDLMQGLINGLKSLGGKVASTVKDIATSPIKIAKKALGIGSPSKVFAGIGSDVGAGLVNGLRGGMADVANAARLSLAAPVIAGGAGPLRGVSRSPAPAAAAAGTRIEKVELHQSVPGGAVPDGDYAANRAIRALERLGKGPL